LQRDDRHLPGYGRAGAVAVVKAARQANTTSSRSTPAADAREAHASTPADASADADGGAAEL